MSRCLGAYERSTLTLPVLGGLASSPKTVLLAFCHAGIARHESSLPQSGLVLRILLNESTSDPVTNSLCLAVETTAGNTYDSIECRGSSEDRERGHRLHGDRLNREVLLNRLAIHDDLACSCHQMDTSYSGLPLAGTPNLRSRHNILPS